MKRRKYLFLFLLAGPAMGWLWACGGTEQPIANPADGGPTGQSKAPKIGENARFIWNEAAVRDKATGLEWQRQAAPFRVEWQTALEHCAGLDLSGDGWRLPTRAELLDLHAVDDALSVFDEAPDWYWSSTPSENRPTAAWAAGVGSYLNSNDQSSSARVRCVRVAAP